MGFNYYIEAFKKYAKFSGRSSRSEYWFFFLYHIIISLIIVFIGIFLNLPILYSIYSLMTLIPSISVAVRRLHDVNFSGLWLLANIVLYILYYGYIFTFGTETQNSFILFLNIFCYLLLLGNSIFIFVILVKGSKYENNKYGPSPKEYNTNMKEKNINDINSDKKDKNLE